MIAFGIIGGGLGLYTKGIKFVPHGILIGALFTAPILHFVKQIGFKQEHSMPRNIFYLDGTTQEEIDKFTFED